MTSLASGLQSLVHLIKLPFAAFKSEVNYKAGSHCMQQIALGGSANLYIYLVMGSWLPAGAYISCVVLSLGTSQSAAAGSPQ